MSHRHGNPVRSMFFIFFPPVSRAAAVSPRRGGADLLIERRGRVEEQKPATRTHGNFMDVRTGAAAVGQYSTQMKVAHAGVTKLLNLRTSPALSQ